MDRESGFGRSEAHSLWFCHLHSPPDLRMWDTGADSGSGHSQAQRDGIFCLIVLDQGLSEIIELGGGEMDREDGGSVRLRTDEESKAGGKCLGQRS